MDAMARAQHTKYWDGKDQIVATLVVKKFTFAMAVDLLVSLKPKDLEFLQFEVDLEDYLGGMMQLPIDLTGTLYHKAQLAQESMLCALHPLIQQRQQVYNNFSHNTSHHRFSLPSIVSIPHMNPEPN